MKIIDSEKAKRARAALKNWGHVVFNYVDENDIKQIPFSVYEFYKGIYTFNFQYVFLR